MASALLSVECTWTCVRILFIVFGCLLVVCVWRIKFTMLSLFSRGMHWMMMLKPLLLRKVCLMLGLGDGVEVRLDLTTALHP